MFLTRDSENPCGAVEVGKKEERRIMGGSELLGLGLRGLRCHPEMDEEPSLGSRRLMSLQANCN